MDKRVLITGGSGSVGSAVVSELLAHQYPLSALCRTAKSAATLPEGVSALMGDINAPENWIDAISEVDVLVHTACGFGDDMGEVDLRLMQAVANAAVKRATPLLVIYTTGCWTFGSQAGQINEQSQPQSIPDFQWMLDNSKWLATQPNIGVRRVSPANVVSEAQQFAMPILHWELERHGQPAIPDIANLSWPIVERRDLASLYRLVLERGQDGEEYIGCATQIPAVTLAGQLADQAIKPVPISDWFATYGTWTEGYGLQQRLSSEKAKTELGWQPRYLPYGR
ncbi:NAD(P)H-binding protein [Bowmanella pacifica]|uniref:NAD-dependent epimerase n=1 Tax=Bowmanella pacifica TaxID=502051 RepID=A0A917YRP7_9ALTE|nr:NAD(P)H-binding protein [Bowmanella pacifica]GGO64380.1 NAD-dependent epimerase [Bowmanella pacifica]